MKRLCLKGMCGPGLVIFTFGFRVCRFAQAEHRSQDGAPEVSPAVTVHSSKMYVCTFALCMCTVCLSAVWRRWRGQTPGTVITDGYESHVGARN